MKIFRLDSFLETLFRKLRFNKARGHIAGDSVVCDIGCGDGRFLEEMSPYIKVGYGLDKKTYKEDKDNLKFLQIRLDDKISLPDESVDVITMLAVLEHLDNLPQILSECFRILKKGSKLVITTPTPIAKPILELLSFKIGLISKTEMADHKNYFWREDLIFMLLEAGFRRENIKAEYFEFLCNNFIIAAK